MGLSAVLGVLDPTGERVDKLLSVASGYLPTWLQLSSAFTYTATKNGNADVYIALGIDPSRTGYAHANIPTGTTNRLAPMFYNDTSDPITLSSIWFVPTDAVSQSNTDFWNVRLVFGSDVTTTIKVFDTTTGSAPDHHALTSGVAVAWQGSVTVPAGDSLVMSIKVGAGSPTTLGGYAQARRV